MARRRFQKEHHPGELNLTAMIDVAFQLLAFFLLAIKPVDVYANLLAARPSPVDPPPVQPVVPSMIKIMVLPQNPGERGTYLVNDSPVSSAQLDARLRRYAETDPSQTILILCAKHSVHQQLIALLDTCAKYKLANLSVVSSAGI